jgi:SNF2 family DNA or RNA helicase
MRAQDGVHPTCNYIIVSYDLLRNPDIQAALSRQKWDLVVMDEAHYVKTVDARRTQALFGTGRYQITGGIIDNAKRMVALTGTPLLNRPRECYTLARHLHWESIDFLSYEGFVARYNPSNSWEERAGRLPELRARLRCNWMVRRHKEDVLKDLPDKRYEMAYVEPDGAIKEVLRKESLLSFDPERLFKGGAWTFDPDEGAISTIRREMGEAKVPRVVEHMRYLLDIVELPKVVMFAHHRGVIQTLSEKLSSYGVSVFQGGMSASAKDAAVASFTRGENKIFLGQIDSAGIGLDGLQQVCSHVVMAEPAWTPGANEQAIDRCHRMGQHDNVLAQFLIAPGSFDEMVLNAVLGKVKTIDEALDGKAED